MLKHRLHILVAAIILTIGGMSLSAIPAYADDEAMAKILEKAHKLPYGDVLCDFFSLFLKMYMSHVHPYPGMQPIVADPDSLAFLTKYGTDKNVLEDKLLSKDIRIN